VTSGLIPFLNTVASSGILPAYCGRRRGFEGSGPLQEAGQWPSKEGEEFDVHTFRYSIWPTFGFPALSNVRSPGGEPKRSHLEMHEGWRACQKSEDAVSEPAYMGDAVDRRRGLIERSACGGAIGTIC